MDVDAVYPMPFALSAVRAVTVRVSREFGVSPERLFAAWLDPRMRDRFLPIACGSGAKICYGEIDRPQRLTFEVHLGGHARPHDHVTVELAPLERGALLVLIHETGVHRAPDRAGLKAAWNASLATLEANLDRKL
jgi:uncharacterized protein YndB with AHSA1/START domain